MKKYVFMLLFLSACNLNVSKTNDQFDKMEAEKITGKYYSALLFDKYDETEDLFSNQVYKNRDSIRAAILNVEKELGDIVTWDLNDWKTLDVSGTDSKSQYILQYTVEYTKAKRTETFFMEKDSGKISIIKFDIK